MRTDVDEIADGIYRLSTFMPEAGLSFNQFLVKGEEPFLFHTGLKHLFPLVQEAVSRLIPVDQLRWISFGHVEADECGSMNDWLAAAPRADVTFGAIGCMVSVNDLADRPPQPLQDGQVLDLGGKRLRYLATAHVPHGWDAGLFFEETTATLLCGDLFTQLGDSGPLSEASPLEAAITAEEQFHATCLTPQTGPTLERLAALTPTTLALMHGPTHRGEASGWLRELAAYYAGQLTP